MRDGRIKRKQNKMRMEKRSYLFVEPSHQHGTVINLKPDNCTTSFLISYKTKIEQNITNKRRRI